MEWGREYLFDFEEITLNWVHSQNQAGQTIYVDKNSQPPQAKTPAQEMITFTTSKNRLRLYGSPYP